MREKNRGSFLLHSREVLIAVLVIGAIASRCIAQLNVWQPNGPVHGSAWGYLTIAADPKKSETVYTGTYHTANGDEGMIFRSANAGPPWTSVSSGLDHSPILKILVDRLNSSILDAATYLGQYRIYKSVDAGENWFVINSAGYHWSFKIARSDSSVIYAIGDALSVSRDRGETWAARQLPNQSPGYRVAVDPYDPNVVIASVCDYYDYKLCNPRLYRSMDAGSTWSQPLLDPPGDDWFSALEFDPLRPNVIYAGGSVAEQPILFKSQDLGNTWTAQSVPGYINELTFDPRTPSVMYATGMMNMARSTDGGTTWTPFTDGIPQFGPGFQAVDFSADGRVIYAATSTGTFKVRVRNELPGSGLVAGRVTTVDGRSVRGALVSMIDSRGDRRWAMTNPFGYYSIGDVPTTITYRIFVRSKTHRFADLILLLNGPVTNMDFIEKPG